MTKDAQRMYETLCNTLTEMKWKFERDDKNLLVRTGAVGDDLSIPLHIVVDEERNLMYTKSPMPFKVPKDRREDVSVAVNMANWSMLNGCFEYDDDSGYLGFKTVVPFGGCLISGETCHYMVILTCQMADRFNDKFEKLVKGTMSLRQFEAFAKEEDIPKA